MYLYCSMLPYPQDRSSPEQRRFSALDELECACSRTGLLAVCFVGPVLQMQYLLATPLSTLKTFIVYILIIQGRCVFPN